MEVSEANWNEALRQRTRPGINRVLAENLFNPQQVIVFHQPIAKLNLS